MKRKHLILIVGGALLWFIETAAFGFNLKPESGLEAFLDTMSLLLIVWGIIADILSGVSVMKNVGAEHKHMQSDKLFLEIKKGATISFGELNAKAKKDISLPLTEGIDKKDMKGKKNGKAVKVS